MAARLHLWSYSRAGARDQRATSSSLNNATLFRRPSSPPHEQHMMLPTGVASQITPFLQGIDQDLRPPFNQEKSLIYTSNYHKSLISTFNYKTR